MIENERKNPGEAEGDGQARHGGRTEVNWDGGRGGQPYANRDAPIGPASAQETEGGNRGAASGRNLEQLEQLRRIPEEAPGRDAPREDATHKGGES